MPDYDLLVLGAGNAGLAAAGVARKAGWTVAIVESRAVGGTCPLRGCVPKKVLVAAAESLDAISRAGSHAIAVAPPRLEWSALIERKETFVKGVPEDFSKSLNKRGIDLIEGAGRFAGRNVVDVNGRRIEARKILIATGSKPRNLPIDGSEHLITSDDILGLPSQPRSLVFVGAGVISLEFTHVFARAGTKVAILEATDRPLPAMDADAVAQVAKATRDLGVEVLTGVKVKAVRKVGSGFEVDYEYNGVGKKAVADVVANGAGRVAAIDDLELDAAGVERDARGGVKVDGFLRSVTNPDVLVAGDAFAGAPQLSPVATYMGKIAGNNLLNGELESPDYSAIPSCVFTVPTLAQVGKTEEAAKKAGLSFDTKVNEMVSWRSARTYAETVAYSKILIEKGSGRILGAHLAGHGAAEVIHTFAFAIRHGVTAAALKETVYAYPTFTSDVQYLV